MMTLARVDLPDPFGPMTAWTCPLLTSRSMPRRISLPSIPARSPATLSVLTSYSWAGGAGGPRRQRRARSEGPGCPEPCRGSRFGHVHEHVAVLHPDGVDGDGQG